MLSLYFEYFMPLFALEMTVEFYLVRDAISQNPACSNRGARGLRGALPGLRLSLSMDTTLFIFLGNPTLSFDGRSARAAF